MNSVRIANPPRAILTAGLIAGTFDITDAFVFSYLYRGVTPTRVLQSVAFGALGPNSFNMGMTSAFLGLCFHFFIALTATAVYYFASLKLPSFSSAR